MKAKTALLSLLLLSPFLSTGASAEEDAIKFSKLTYPIEIQLAAQKEGSVLYETPFSAEPSVSYDTILLQGEMPDQGVSVELIVKSKSFLTASARYNSESFRRFPNGRFWARYRVPLSRQPLKLSLVNRGVKSASSITIYETELLIEQESKEEPVPAASTTTYVPDPELFYPAGGPFKLIRRADWQAAAPKSEYTPHAPKYFTLHHTQAHYPQTYERAVSEMQFIQDYHQNAKKWIDIGYHFLIDPLGNIFEGRPIKVVGAHVLSSNTGNVGISIMGNYHPPADNVFADASRDSFVAVGRYIAETYSVNVSSFYAHRDIGNSDCPGDSLYAKKGLLRDLIFNPRPQELPVDPAIAPALTPAQQKSLEQLKRYLNGQ
jgi:hypothetical protein